MSSLLIIKLTRIYDSGFAYSKKEKKTERKKIPFKKLCQIEKDSFQANLEFKWKVREGPSSSPETWVLRKAECVECDCYGGSLTMTWLFMASKPSEQCFLHLIVWLNCSSTFVCIFSSSQKPKLTIILRIQKRLSKLFHLRIVLLTFWRLTVLQMQFLVSWDISFTFWIFYLYICVEKRGLSWVLDLGVLFMNV